MRKQRLNAHADDLIANVLKKASKIYLAIKGEPLQVWASFLCIKDFIPINNVKTSAPIERRIRETPVTTSINQNKIENN